MNRRQFETLYVLIASLNWDLGSCTHLFVDTIRVKKQIIAILERMRRHWIVQYAIECLVSNVLQSAVWMHPAFHWQASFVEAIELVVVHHRVGVWRCNLGWREIE